MAQECGFFNAQLVGDGIYDRVYLAEQFAAYFASFIGNGVFGKSMQKLEIISKDIPDMSVQVLSGEGWINGWWYRNTDVYTLNLQIADGVLSRIDAIVLRWGNTERDIWLEVITGEPSANPQVPPLRRDADYYDLRLGYINVTAGSVRITQAQITDTRLDNTVCGLVTGVIDQIDTTDLYNQFTAYFTEFKEKHEADFDKWSEEQKKAFLDYVAYQKGLYDRYIAELQSDYDNWTTEKKTEWAQWVTEQESDFTKWVLNEKVVYETWTDAQRQAYVDWYNVHTDLWEQQFNEWFENIKNKLSGEIAGALQNQIDALESKQPKVQVADIEHNLDVYVRCDLYETTYACGVQGAGEGPAGGGSLISSPVEYEMVDRNHIKIKAIDGLGVVEEVKSLGKDMWAVLFENRIKSLVAIIDDRGKSKNEKESEEK